MQGTSLVPYYEQAGLTLFNGCCLDVLRALPAESVNCCVTSPPYFHLRNYGIDGQIGLEKSPQEYVDALTKIFREIRRVLLPDGTLWLNLGDSYAGSGKGGNPEDSPHFKQRANIGTLAARPGDRTETYGLKEKDMIGIPWMVAFALRADGWYLRRDIIWSKPNPMPESVLDRPTTAHEYIFLLSKSPKYFYDSDAIREPMTYGNDDRWNRGDSRRGSECNQISPRKMRPVYGAPSTSVPGVTKNQTGRTNGGKDVECNGMRNKRSVWTVLPQPFKSAHFATFPPKLIEPCILAGSAPGGVVLDPFNGAGTTGLVCQNHGRKYIGIELNPAYCAMTVKRIAQQVFDFFPLPAGKAER